MGSGDKGLELCVTVLLLDKGALLGSNSFSIPSRGSALRYLALSDDVTVELTLNTIGSMPIASKPNPAEDEQAREIGQERAQEGQECEHNYWPPPERGQVQRCSKCGAPFTSSASTT